MILQLGNLNTQIIDFTEDLNERKEVFEVKRDDGASYQIPYSDAPQICKNYGAELAKFDKLKEAIMGLVGVVQDGLLLQILLLQQRITHTFHHQQQDVNKIVTPFTPSDKSNVNIVV